MTPNWLIVGLEIKLHLLHRHVPAFIIFLVNYTAHLFYYLSLAAVLYELFSLAELCTALGISRDHYILFQTDKCRGGGVILQWNILKHPEHCAKK